MFRTHAREFTGLQVSTRPRRRRVKKGLSKYLGFLLYFIITFIYLFIYLFNDFLQQYFSYLGVYFPSQLSWKDQYSAPNYQSLSQESNPRQRVYWITSQHSATETEGKKGSFKIFRLLVILYYHINHAYWVRAIQVHSHNSSYDNSNSWFQEADQSD